MDTPVKRGNFPKIGNFSVSGVHTAVSTFSTMRRAALLSGHARRGAGADYPAIKHYSRPTWTLAARKRKGGG